MEINDFLKIQNLKIGTKVIVDGVDYSVEDFELSMDSLSVVFKVRDTNTSKEWKQSFSKDFDNKSKLTETVTNVIEPVTETISNTIEAIENTVDIVSENLKDIVEETKTTVTKSFGRKKK